MAAPRPWLWLLLTWRLAGAPAAELVRESLVTPPAGWTLGDPWRFTPTGLTAAVRGAQARLLVPGTAQLADGRASVTVQTRAADPADLRAGLLFRASDVDNGWFVLVRADGAYWLGRLVAGHSDVQLSGSIDPGPAGRPLALSVLCRGDRQTIALNGLPLITRTVSGGGQGGVGLWVAGSGAAAFTDLVVEDASGGLRPVGTPTQTVVSGRGPEAVLAPGGVLPGGPAGASPPSLNPPTGGLPVPPNPAPDVPPAPGAKPLFAEDFNPPRHRWNRDEFRTIDQGWLRLRSGQGYQLSGFPYDFADFVYTAQAQSLSAAGGTLGLVARLGRDGNSGYVCVIREPDLFAVARLDQGKATILQRGSVALSGGIHTLKVTCVGADLGFSVDDRPLVVARDDKYAKGGIGLWVDNKREARFTNLLVHAAAAADVPKPEPRRGRVLVNETFDPPALPWQQDSQRLIRDGRLHLFAPPGRSLVSGVADPRLIDYAAQAEGERVEGLAEGRLGLLVRLQADGRSGYLLALAADGAFVVLKVNGAQVEQLAQGVAKVRPGVNTLGARCAGSSLRFALNGAEVAAVQDATWPAGGVGLYADNGLHARFGALRAEELP